MPLLQYSSSKLCWQILPQLLFVPTPSIMQTYLLAHAMCLIFSLILLSPPCLDTFLSSAVVSRSRIHHYYYYYGVQHRASNNNWLLTPDFCSAEGKNTAGLQLHNGLKCPFPMRMEKISQVFSSLEKVKLSHIDSSGFFHAQERNNIIHNVHRVFPLLFVVVRTYFCLWQFCRSMENMFYGSI